MNKYFIAKIVLGNPENTSPLIKEVDDLSEMLETPDRGWEFALKHRMLIIDDNIRAAIKTYPCFSGVDTMTLLEQYTDIMKKLARFEDDYLDRKCYEVQDRTSFKYWLEYWLHATYEHILWYELAEQKLTGKSLVYVIPNGGRDNLPNPQVWCMDRTFSHEEMRSLVEKLGKDRPQPILDLYASLSLYTNESSECAECLLDRTIEYNVATDHYSVIDGDINLS